MENVEVIEALQNCANANYEYQAEGASCSKCPYNKVIYCKRTLMRAATDALKATEKRIVELEKELEIWTARSFEGKIGSMALTNLNLKKEIYELKAQLPKEGEWITTRTEYHDGEIYCSICDHDAPTEGDYRQVKTKYCPNCGAKMKGGNDD